MISLLTYGCTRGLEGISIPTIEPLDWLRGIIIFYDRTKSRSTVLKSTYIHFQDARDLTIALSNFL